MTGADTDPAINGIPFGTNSIHYVHDGQVISLGAPHAGLRGYLAVRGGIDVSPVLGSRSRRVSAIGPLTLAPGESCPSASTPKTSPSSPRRPSPPSRRLLELMVVPGPRADWFANPEVLVHTRWPASNRSDRVGIRLVGCRWNTGRPIVNCPARAPPAAQSKCHPTAVR